MQGFGRGTGRKNSHKIFVIFQGFCFPHFIRPRKKKKKNALFSFFLTFLSLYFFVYDLFIFCAICALSLFSDRAISGRFDGVRQPTRLTAGGYYPPLQKPKGRPYTR